MIRIVLLTLLLVSCDGPTNPDPRTIEVLFPTAGDHVFQGENVSIIIRVTIEYDTVDLLVEGVTNEEELQIAANHPVNIGDNVFSWLVPDTLQTGVYLIHVDQGGEMDTFRPFHGGNFFVMGK